MDEKGRRAPPADLSAIDGIGRKTADGLGRAGVDSMAALAAMTVDEIVEALAGAGISVKARKIVSNQWLQQAWRLSHEASSGHRSEPADAEGRDQTEPAVDDWEEKGGYFIYFDRAQRDGEEQWRTRIWDTTAMDEAELPGAAPGPWVAYILARAGLPPTSGDDTDPAFEVRSATISHEGGESGAETWMTAEIAVKVQHDDAFERAVGAALMTSALRPEPPGLGPNQ